MSSYVQLGGMRTFYEEDGSGEPLVLLHPGGADSRAFEVNLPGLADRFRVLRPDRRGHSDGRRWRCWSRWPVPTWSAGWCSPPGLPPRRLGSGRHRPGRGDHRLLRRLPRRGLPRRPDAFPALAAKLHRMHSQEPTLTVADLAGYPGPSLVMVDDDDEDEIPIQHTLALRQGCRGHSWRSCPAPATGCRSTSPSCSTGSWSTSSPGHRRRRPMIARIWQE